MKHPLPALPRRRGFTLLELILCVSILAILAGAAIPLAATYINSQARDTTYGEVDLLGNAVAEYFRDLQSLPSELGALEQNPGSASWAGPYIVSSGIDRLSGLPGAQADAWGQAYTLKAAGSSAVVINSAGSDHASGTTDDVSLTVDVTPIRREISLERLRTINQAVRQYNAQFLGSSNLSSDWNTALGQLVKTGFLPDDAQYKTDGWGDAFVPDPKGAKPVVRINSPHLAGGASVVPVSEDDDEDGKGKGKDKDKDKDGKKDKDHGDDKGKGKVYDDKGKGK